MSRGNLPIARLEVEESAVKRSPGVAAGRIKGAAFREFLSFYVRRGGDQALADVARSLPTKWQKLLDPERLVLGVLASEWYEAEAVHALLDALTGKLSPMARERLAQEGADAVMSRTLRGLYRVLFNWMATPERYARFGQKLWNAYYDGGQVRVDMPDATTAVSTISDWSTHHPFICDLNRWAARSIYTAMGCQSVSVERTACVALGDAHCRFVSTWA